MKLAKQARHCLKGQWKGAVLAQWSLMTAGLLLLLLEVLILRITGIGIEEVLHFDELMGDSRLLLHALIIVGIVLLDVFLTSPLRLGQAAYYYQLAGRGGEKKISSKILRSFYTAKRYGRSLRWRLSIWWRRAAWSLVCYTPAALILGYGQLLVDRGETGILAEINLLFAGFFGLFALLAGFVSVQMIMLRYMPVQYLLYEEKSVHQAFRRSRKLMRGRTGEVAWVYAGFSGWLITCVLFLPYFYVSPLFLTSRALWVKRAEMQQKREEELEWAQTRPIEDLGTAVAHGI